MRCTGELCERKMDCARYYINAKPDGQAHTIESLYSFGSGSISSEGNFEVNLLCSPLGDWGMFIPIERTNADRIRAMSDEELAGLLTRDGMGCYFCAEICVCNGPEDLPEKSVCRSRVLKWLKQPTE